MEDVLHLYERPWDPKEPVICLDEKSVQLLEDSRPVKPARPGLIGKQDSEGLSGTQDATSGHGQFEYPQGKIAD